MQSESFAPGTLFARIFHASPVAMIVTSVEDGRYVDVNTAYADLVGVGRESLLNRPNEEFRQVDLATAGGDAATPTAISEHRIYLHTAIGDLRHILATTQKEEWDGRDFYFTIIRDLTHIKRAEDTLRATEQRYRLFFESVPLPVFVYDLETLRVLDVNAAAIEQYGYSREEFMLIDMLDIRPEEERQKFLHHVPTMPRDIRTFGVWPHQNKDGTVMDMEVTGYALEVDGRSARIAVCQDVTDQLAVQAALRASEERYRVIAEVSNDVLWDADVVNQLVTFSEGMRDVFGHTLPAVVPLGWWVENIHPDERDAAGGSYFAAVEGESERWSSNYRFRRADGHYSHVLDRGHIFRDDSGRATRVIGAMIDITRQVEMKEAATRAAMAERRRLARDLHDAVTQSLYSLMLLSEAARRTAEAGDHKAANDYISRLGELAQQCLKELRLLVHEMRPSLLEKEGLAGALQARLDAVERHSGIRAQFMIEFDKRLSPALQLQYYRVAEEALNNALKHAGATAVRVYIQADDHSATLEISDNGRGFDPREAAASGGLGLVGMRERMEKLGGQLDIETAPGKGTTIRVYSLIGNNNNGQ